MIVDVRRLRDQAESCLLTAQECDRRANTFWSWLTRQRFDWRREACWWRVQKNDWNDLADQIEEGERVSVQAMRVEIGKTSVGGAG